MSNIKIKDGMGGSRCGKGRRDPTGLLKVRSKKRRRLQSKQVCKEQQD